MLLSFLFVFLSVGRGDLASDLAHVNAAFDAAGIVRVDGTDWTCYQSIDRDVKLLATGEVGRVSMSCVSGAVSSIAIVRARDGLKWSSLTGLPAAFFAELAYLPGLTRFSISETGITGLPDTLGQLAALTTLNIYVNSELTALPDTIGQLTGLRSLVLHHNALTELPSTIGQLTHLAHLSADDNSLSSLPASFSQLSSLTHLYLERNPLNSAVPESIFQLTSLTFLYMDGVDATSIPDSIGQLTELTHLRLRSNALTSLPDSMSKLTALTYFFLSDNPRLTWLPDLSYNTNLQKVRMDSNSALRCVPKLPSGKGPFSATDWNFRADKAAIDGGMCREPTAQPTAIPTTLPSAQPTLIPTSQPSVQPTGIPSVQPSAQPTSIPSTQPSAQPTVIPTFLPTEQPTFSELEKCQMQLEQFQTPIVLMGPASTIVVQAGSFVELKQRAAEAFGGAITPATMYSYTARIPASHFHADLETEVTQTILDEGAFRVAVGLAVLTDAVLHLQIV